MATAKNKKKKEKVIYYDDGSTIADMSAVNREGKRDPNYGKPKRRSTFGEKWQTYWDAVRLMIIPMFIVLGFIFLVFAVGLILGRIN